MAGKSRFRVPTLGEMESTGNTSTTVRPLFQSHVEKKKGNSSADSSALGSSDSPSSSQKSKRSLASRNSHMPLPDPVGPQGRAGRRSLASLKSMMPLPSPSGTAKTKSPAKHMGDSQPKGKKLSTAKKSSQDKTVAAPVTTKRDDDDIVRARDLCKQFPGARNYLSSRTNVKPFVGSSSSLLSSASAASSSLNGTDASVAASRLRLEDLEAETKPSLSAAASATIAGSASSSGTATTSSGGPSTAGASTSTDAAGDASAKKDDIDLQNLPTLAKLGNTSSIIVNPRQRGNPIIKHIRSAPWEYGNIIADYVMGQAACALFLSLRYHQLHSTYIHERLKQLGRSFDLRVLLVQVDIKEPQHLVKELAKICIMADCTLILAFSAEEAGRYLESYKVYENKPPDAIMEKSETDFMSKLTDCLTTVKSVNKTDCATLMSSFGSLETIMKASEEDLSMCPGFGPQKAKRLHEVFHEPFLKIKKRKLAQEQSTSTASSGT